MRRELREARVPRAALGELLPVGRPLLQLEPAGLKVHDLGAASRRKWMWPKFQNTRRSRDGASNSTKDEGA